ncbi:VanW family protein [Actinosynnema sp. NPDC020468]|uniref:VanW family protein n=1 Tax=Actinosynnema sp. NPDC020468 TaxID=3154488 RepID=UPI0033CC3957
MPENERPEYDAERTRAMQPVRPSDTASERTAHLAPPEEAAWPSEEPDEPDASPAARDDQAARNEPTVRNVPPADSITRALGGRVEPPAPTVQSGQSGPTVPLGQSEKTQLTSREELTRALPDGSGEATQVFAPVSADPTPTPPPTPALTPTPAPPSPEPARSPWSAAEQTTVFATPVAEPEATVLGPVMVDPEVEADEVAAAKKKRFRRLGLVAASVLGVLVVLYGLDILISNGNVPRGVTVAGVDVGGLSHSEAETKLRERLSPRLEQPVKAKAGDVETEIDPKAAGLALDWNATIERAGSQPLSPITRVTSFFTSREVGFATQSDNAKLTAAVEGLRPKTDHDPSEGTIKFEGAKASAVDPRQGQKLDAPAATTKILADWAGGGVVELPVATTPVKTTKEGVAKALAEVGTPAVAAPLVIKGEGKDATLKPEQIGAVLVFEPADGGGLTAKVDPAKVSEAAGPQLKETEKEGKDAEIVFEGGHPVVKESVDGRGVDWEKTSAPLLDLLKKADGREVKAEYKHTPAKVTTEQANKMGIKEVIGSFETGGFAADSGTNIRVVAEKVDGAIVKPGETFSLNGYTGPRGTAQGYVEAGIIDNGAPSRAVGGGISQFATTLYNAGYHAGMKDAGHKEHSYWISRYPAGREATVFMDPAGNSLIDIRFQNPDETGVAIQTIWTPSSIKIVLWGTKNYDVTGSTSEKSAFTEPQEIKKTTKPCAASAGAQGFTVTDTRTVTDRRTGVARSESRTVRYDPSPKIVCEEPKPAGG